MLYALLYPRFSDQDALEIKRFRSEFEPRRAKMICPHITLVFGVTSIEPGALIDKTQRVCAAIKPIVTAFTGIEQAFDRLDQTYKLFLLPSGGEQTIIAMHQALYDGPHAAELRQDIPYRPHMTIATSADLSSSNAAIKEARHLRLPIDAHLTAVTLVKRDGERIEQFAEVPFSG